MCECLCSEVQGDMILHLPKVPAAIAVDAYMGCQECGELVGIDVRVFTTQGVQDFLDGNWGRTAEPSDYGLHDPPFCFEIFNVDDFMAALRDRVEIDPDTEDLIRHEFVTIMQIAAGKCEQRRHKGEAP